MTELLSADLKQYFQAYANEIFRIVEGQHFIATRKLVDTDEEQRLLEEMLDDSKPPAAKKNSRGPLHYLLYTPFRYPPLKSGCRFHTRLEQSIFYGSEELLTAMAEIAYGRFLFLKHSEAKLKPMQVPYTHFVIKVKSCKAILLTQTPFTEQKNRISDPSSHLFSQYLGSLIRKAGAEMFTYHSARMSSGTNVGLFCMEAFQKNKPVSGKEGHWTVYAKNELIEFQRVSFSDNRKESHVFKAGDFL